MLDVKKKDYEKIMMQLKKLSETDIQQLESKSKSLTEERDRLKDQARRIGATLSDLTSLLATYDIISSEETKVLENIHKLIEKNGDADSIQKEIGRIQSLLKQVNDSRSSFDNYDKLVELALSYLTQMAEHISACPVCQQNIDTKKVIHNLSSSISKSIQDQIYQLNQNSDMNKKELTELKDALDRIKLQESTLQNSRLRLTDVIHKISPIIGYEPSHRIDITSKIDSLTLEVNNINSTISDNSEQLGSSKNAMEQYRSLVEKSKLTCAEINELLGKQTYHTLSISEIDDAIQKIEGDMKKYKDASSIDSFKSRLTKQSKVVSFIKQQDEVNRLESQLPHINEVLSDRREKIEKIEFFDRSLQAVQEITSVYAKDLVTKTLHDIETNLNQYYKALESHQVFNKLKIDIVKEDPIVYQIKASSPDNDSFIPTRFSTTQANAAAIAIFLANNSRSTSHLDFMLIDDPTQSMDEKHLKSVSDILVQLTKDRQLIIASQDEKLVDNLSNSENTETITIDSWNEQGPLIAN